jgi:YbbR domain-containing protein
MKKLTTHPAWKLLDELFTWENLRRMICYDPWRRIIALFLAFCLWWSLVHKDVDSQAWRQVREVPVKFDSSQAADAGLWLDNANPANVTINLAQNYRGGVKDIAAEDFELKIDLNKLRQALPERSTKEEAGTFAYTLSENDITTKPGGISIRSFEPAAITLKWDRLITRHQIPVAIDYDDSRLAGSFQVDVKPDKQYVSITGPEFLVSQIKEIPTDKLLITSAAQTRLSARLVTDPRITLQDSDRLISCSVSFTSRREIITRKIERVRIKILDRPDTMQICDPNYRIPHVVTVTLTGPREKVNSLAADNIVAYCDLSPFSTSDIYTVNVQVVGIPPSVTVQSIIPGQVNIKLISRTSKAAAQ